MVVPVLLLSPTEVSSDDDTSIVIIDFMQMLMVLTTQLPYLYISYIQNVIYRYINHQDDSSQCELGGGFKYFFMFTPIWGRFPV